MPHGMLDPYSLSVKRLRKTLYLWLIERRNVMSAQRLVYTTEEEERLAGRGIGSPPQGAVVPLGGDAPWQDSDDLASRFLGRFPEGRGRRQLLFLGRLHHKKGLDRILAVFPSIVRRVPDVLLTIVGDGTTDYEASLRNVILEKGLAQNVLMTGRLDGQAKWGAYASSKMFLLPSRQENFAITVAEAMHMAIPVVVTNRVNTWPYVSEAQAGIVLDETEVERELETNILTLLGDPSIGRAMGERGRRYARENLTWVRAADRLLDCYGEAIRTHEARQRSE
jgi:glycosyltransferase involved in cell wall biosynthesis